MRRLPVILVLILALVMTACSDSDDAAGTTLPTDEPPETTEAPPTPDADAEEPITEDTAPEEIGDDEPMADVLIVATTSILGDVVEQLVGESATIEVIMGAGIDPHDFQPSAAQAALLQEADLVVANGLGLIPALTDLIEDAEEEKDNVIEVAEHLDPIPFLFDLHDDDDDDDDHADEEEDAHGDEDPHFWQDPVRMADAVGLIAGRLAELDTGVAADEWQARADAYAGEILAAHDEIESLLGAIPEDQRLLVTNHEAFGYLADRYGFEVIGVVIPGGGTLAEPSPADIADLVEEIEHEGVSAIFAENTDPSLLAQVIADEVGEEVSVFELFSDSLGEPGTGAETYVGLILTNARIISEALS